MLSSQVHRYRCAQCWGPVVLKCVEGAWLPVCPKGCQPGGVVSETYVDHRRANDSIDAAKVAANYPQLAPDTRTPEDRDADKRALFG